MDFTILPASAQAQLAQMSIDQGVVSSLPQPASGSPAAVAFSPAAARLDLSAQAQALLAGGEPVEAGDDSAPGPGWETGYNPSGDSTNTGFDSGPPVDDSWVYGS